jgi:hypothetical protein
VRVVGGDQPGAVGLFLAGGVPQDDPGGDAGRADEHRHRPGVLLAVAPLEPEEVGEVVAGGARLGGQAVHEAVGRVGEVLEHRAHPVVGGLRPGAELGSQRGDVGGQLRQLGVPPHRVVDRQVRRGLQRVDRGLGLLGGELVGQVLGGDPAAEHGAARPVEPPVVVGGAQHLHLLRGVGDGQELVVVPQDGDPLANQPTARGARQRDQRRVVGDRLLAVQVGQVPARVVVLVQGDRAQIAGVGDRRAHPEQVHRLRTVQLTGHLRHRVQRGAQPVAGAAPAQPAGQRALGERGHEQRQDDAGHQRQRPDAQRGERAGAQRGAAAAAGAVQQPGPLVGPEQHREAGGRSEEGDQLHVAGDGADRHAVEDEQAQPAERRLPRRYREQVDRQRHQADEQRGQRHQAAQRQRRGGLLLDLGHAVGEQPGQVRDAGRGRNEPGPQVVRGEHPAEDDDDDQ